MGGFAFGPVPSRRLGRSLGVNNIPYKFCSYSCVYCQLGRTLHLEAVRREFYPWRDIVDDVVHAVGRVGRDNIDFITFVPDGEPTLDINLGREIAGIKGEVDLPVAVLTNASLLFRDDVRADLAEADLVSVKVDASREKTFRVINRPHPSIKLDDVLWGIREFSRVFRGRLITETMLVYGVNDSVDEAREIASFISSLNPYRAYVAVPTRPPAEPWVKPPPEDVVFRIFEVFREVLGDRVELLISIESGSFGISLERPIEDLLNIVSVHPLLLEYAEDHLRRAGLDPQVVIKNLVDRRLVTLLEWRGKYYLFRRFSRDGDQRSGVGA